MLAGKLSWEKIQRSSMIFPWSGRRKPRCPTGCPGPTSEMVPHSSVSQAPSGSSQVGWMDLLNFTVLRKHFVYLCYEMKLFKKKSWRNRQIKVHLDVREWDPVQRRHAAVPQLRGQRGGGGAGAPDHSQQVPDGGGGVDLTGIGRLYLRAWRPHLGQRIRLWREWPAWSPSAAGASPSRPPSRTFSSQSWSQHNCRFPWRFLYHISWFGRQHMYVCSMWYL